MLVITHGYLINREDYDTFDEILTFINEHGNKFTCFSMGSRKINSKNGRNLDYLNYLEYSFFYSSNKLCRLKKVTTISNVDFVYKDKLSIQLINQFLFKFPKFNKKMYELYQQIIYLIINNLNDFLLMLYISYEILKILKLNFLFDDQKIIIELNKLDNLNNWNYQTFSVNQIRITLKDILMQIYKITNIYLNVINFI